MCLCLPSKIWNVHCVPQTSLGAMHEFPHYISQKSSKSRLHVMYLCVLWVKGNPIFIDEETEDLRNKCFLENLFELPKGKVNTQTVISLFIIALCHLVNNWFFITQETQNK